jgi:hypothetical protein
MRSKRGTIHVHKAWTAACAIADVFDSPDTLFNGYIPAINGSDTNFSQPFVLTYPNDSVPTDKPRPQLVVTNITGFSNTSPPFQHPRAGAGHR